MSGVALSVLAIVLAAALLPAHTHAESIPQVLTERMTGEVINVYPHDPDAFTQGLIYLDGFLYESTGLYGKSSLRKIALETGKVLQARDLPPEYFAEGLAECKGRLVQLTWREKTGFIYRRDDLSRLGAFTYPTEGWGLTCDGRNLVMSDGTHFLTFLDPQNLRPIRRIAVTHRDRPLGQINELEYIQGQVWANIWQTNRIARIDPADGRVLGWIDLRRLFPIEQRPPAADVLNGIAYDARGNRLFVTGKRWPRVFEIRLVPATR